MACGLGYHLHYAKLNGIRSDVLFAFGSNSHDPGNPVTWERHGSGKARYFPDPDSWSVRKRENVNKVCLATKANPFHRVSSLSLHRLKNQRKRRDPH